MASSSTLRKRSPLRWAVLFSAFLFTAFHAGTALGQDKNWQIVVTGRVDEDQTAPPYSIILGASDTTTDGYDEGVDIITPGPPSGALIYLASYHLRGAPGFEQFFGITDLRIDLRSPIRPAEEKVWRVKLRYLSPLPLVTMRLSWPALTLPGNLTARMGVPNDFLPGGSGGIDMKTRNSATFPIASLTDNLIEIHVRDVGVATPYVLLVPRTATVQVGQRISITAQTLNTSGSPQWSWSGGQVIGGGTRVDYIAPATPGTYTVTATVTGMDGTTTATDTATITVTPQPALGPDIYGFEPIAGPVGTRVTLYGVRFAPIADDNVVEFMGAGGRVQAQIDLSLPVRTTQLTVIVPVSAVTGTIKITMPVGNATSANPFTVLVPQTGIENQFQRDPRMAPVGAIIGLTNRSLNKWDASTEVLINGTVAPKVDFARLVSLGLFERLGNSPENVIYRIVPEGVLSGPVVARTGGIIIRSTSDFQLLRPPTLDKMSRNSWEPAVEPVIPNPTLTGDNFVEYPSPEGAGPPSFKYIVSYPGMPDFDRHTNVQVVEDSFPPRFLGTKLSTDLLLRLAPSILTGPITIGMAMINPVSGLEDPIGEITTPIFTVIRNPRIDNFSPDVGRTGDVVYITGQYFDPSNPLNNTVRFSGLSPDLKSVVPDAAQATVRLVSPDGKTMEVVVPPGALTGPITVTIAGKSATNAKSFTVLPSVTIIPIRARVRAGNDSSIRVTALVGGLSPTQSQDVTWTQLPPELGFLNPDPEAPGDTHKRIYLPPATVAPVGGVIPEATPVRIAATTVAQIVVNGQPMNGRGESTYDLLPPLSFTVNPPVIDVLDPSSGPSFPLTATGVGGVDLSKVAWRIEGDELLNNNPGGPGALSTTTGPTTTYTAPRSANLPTLRGRIVAEIADLALRAEVPVTIGQPALKILGYNMESLAQTTATISWQMDQSQRAVSYIEYGLSPQNLTTRRENLLAPGTPNSAGSAQLTGLQPNTTYSFRITATGSGYSPATMTGSFTTPAQAKIVVTPNPMVLRPGSSQVLTAAIQNGPVGAKVKWSTLDPTKLKLTALTDGTNRAVVEPLAVATSGESYRVIAEPNGFLASPDIVTVSIAGNITITADPSLLTMTVGQPAREVQVTVTGAIDRRVTATLRATTPDVTGLGKIEAVDEDTFRYTPPADLPETGLPRDPNLVVRIEFRPVEDLTKSAAIIATILPPVRVTISPTTPQTVKVGGKLFFTASTKNSSGSTQVTYQVNGIQGGNTTVGTIGPTGEYNAPTVAPSEPVKVTARSYYDPSRSSVEVPVTILPGARVTIDPPAQNVGLGLSAKFTATVLDLVAGLPAGVTWSIVGENPNGILGTITPDGTYTAPQAMPSAPLSPTVTLKATSVGVPSASAIATATILPGVVVNVVALSTNVTAGKSITLTAVVQNYKTDRGVTWSVNGVPNGNDEVGRVTPNGSIGDVATYTAPAKAPLDPVRITATSREAPGVSDTVGVEVNPRPVAIDPAQMVVAVGNTVAFFLKDAENGSLLSNVTWEVVEGETFGTIDADGVYTAPSVVPDPAFATIRATQATGEGYKPVTATTVVSIVPRMNIRVVPAEVNLEPGAKQTFQAVDDRDQPVANIAWLIASPASGGGSIVRNTGEYAAPAEVPTGFDVRIAAVAPTGDRSQALIHLGASIPPVALLTGPNVRYLPDSARAVDIAWGTDVDSDSRVEIGTEAGVYSNAFPLTALVKEHVVRVTGLVPGATYHYRVISTVRNRTGLVSPDRTFTARGELLLGIDLAGNAAVGLTVDGTRYTGAQLPRTFVWTIGQEHSIVPDALVGTDPSTQHVFNGWDDTSLTDKPIEIRVAIPAAGRRSLKALYAPVDRSGPGVTAIAASPNPTAGASEVRLQATVSDLGLGDASIAGAEFFAGTPATPGTGTAMAAIDGAFDESTEEVFAPVDVSDWKVGEKRTLYVEGRDNLGNWGDLRAYEIIVSDALTVRDIAVKAGQQVSFRLTLSGVTGIQFVSGLLRYEGPSGSLTIDRALTLAPGGEGLTLSSEPDGADTRIRLIGSSPFASDTVALEGTLVIPHDAKPDDVFRLHWSELHAVDGNGQSMTLRSDALRMTVEVRMGDVNGNGRIDIGDVILCLRIAVGLLSPVPPAMLDAADVAPLRTNGTYGDGFVGINDATRILRRAVGLEVDPWP